MENKSLYQPKPLHILWFLENIQTHKILIAMSHSALLFQHLLSFMPCFLRAHLTDAIPALLCNYLLYMRATSFSTLNELAGSARANE